MAVKKTTSETKPLIRKNAVIKAKPKGMANNRKKSEEEKTEIQCLISIGLRKCSSAKEILEELKERNFKISVSTFYQYIKDIRAEWRTAMSENYESHIASQYAKLDLMESRLWQMLDKSMNPEEKKTVERQGGRGLTEKTETTSSHGDVEIMKMIERIWVRRNEILGITSSTVNIQNNIQNNIEQNTTVEVTKVEFQPVSDKFFGNFVIQVEDRQKP